MDARELFALIARLETQLEQGTELRSDELNLVVPGVAVDWTTFAEKYPGGYSLPPPPPGYGPQELQGAYVVDRSWGQIWFTFHTGDRVVRVAFAPGRRGSPGV